MHPDTHAYHAGLAPEARTTSVAQVDPVALERWLGTARTIQRDFKNLVRREGRWERLA